MTWSSASSRSDCSSICCWARWAQATVTGLVVDLGEPASWTAARPAGADARRPDARGGLLAARAGPLRRRGGPAGRAAGGRGGACADADRRGRPASGSARSRPRAPGRPRSPVAGRRPRRGWPCRTHGCRRRCANASRRWRPHGAGSSWPPTRSAAASSASFEAGRSSGLLAVAELVVDLDPELERQLEAAQAELDALRARRSAAHAHRRRPGRGAQGARGTVVRPGHGRRAGLALSVGSRSRRVLHLLRGARERGQARTARRTRASVSRRKTGSSRSRSSTTASVAPSLPSAPASTVSPTGWRRSGASSWSRAFAARVRGSSRGCPSSRPSSTAE